MKPELIALDFDGTLVEFHLEFLLSESMRILPDLGYGHITTEELREHFASFDFFAFAFEPEHQEGPPPANAPMKKDELTEVFWEKFDWDGFPQPQPLPGVASALEQIKNSGIKLALATARYSTEDGLRKLLAPTGLLEYLDGLYCRLDLETDWTDKRGTLGRLLADFNCPAEKACMIGDIPPDVTSAKDIGFGSTYAVLSGGIKKELLEAAVPTEIIQSVAELPQVLGLSR